MRGTSASSNCFWKFSTALFAACLIFINTWSSNLSTGSFLSPAITAFWQASRAFARLIRLASHVSPNFCVDSSIALQLASHTAQSSVCMLVIARVTSICHFAIAVRTVSTYAASISLISASTSRVALTISWKQSKYPRSRCSRLSFISPSAWHRRLGSSGHWVPSVPVVGSVGAGTVSMVAESLGAWAGVPADAVVTSSPLSGLISKNDRYFFWINELHVWHWSHLDVAGLGSVHGDTGSSQSHLVVFLSYHELCRFLLSCCLLSRFCSCPVKPLPHFRDRLSESEGVCSQTWVHIPHWLELCNSRVWIDLLVPPW